MSADSNVQTPVGVWAGEARFDGRTEGVTLSFAADGTVALQAATSAGRGRWVGGGAGRFTYHLSEEVRGPDGRTGRVAIDIDAELAGAEYRGVSTAKIYGPTGDLVRTVPGSITARRQAAEPAGWHTRK